MISLIRWQACQNKWRSTCSKNIWPWSRTPRRQRSASVRFQSGDNAGASNLAERPRVWFVVGPHQQLMGPPAGNSLKTWHPFCAARELLQPWNPGNGVLQVAKWREKPWVLHSFTLKHNDIGGVLQMLPSANYGSQPEFQVGAQDDWSRPGTKYLADWFPRGCNQPETTMSSSSRKWYN